MIDKVWDFNDNFFGVNNKNNDEVLKIRCWKSVESLMREIEIKCFFWFENCYGFGMI